MTTFFRVLDVPIDEKAQALRDAIHGGSAAADVDPSEFRSIPGAPFAYWTSSTLRSIYARNEAFECPPRIVRQGGVTGNDARFLRAHWEVPRSRDGHSVERWVPFAKGGNVSLWYSSYPVVVRWDDRRTTFFGYTGLLHRASEKPSSADHYFKPALTWPLRAMRFAPVPLPRGCVFSIRGYAILAPEAELLSIGALCNALVFDYLFKIALGGHRSNRPEFVVGVLQKLPYPKVSPEQAAHLAKVASRAWSLKRRLDSVRETSHAFVLPGGLNEKVTGLDAQLVENELGSIQQEVSAIGLELYDIQGSDRLAIETFFAKSERSEGGERQDEDAEADDEDSDNGSAGGALASWLVGVAFGRFDPRPATRTRPIPPEPEPFDPLPSRSPGMYPQGEDPADLPDILVDDEGQADDLAGRVRAVAETVDVDVPENLRAWLAKEFFPLHIKMYSKSHRKAPIYWQLATPSASYSVWLYIHAFSKDTIFRVQNEYVAPKLAHEERRLQSLTSELRDGATAAQRKTLAAQQGVVEELRAFLEEVKRVAPLWNPNLDDGVVINFAPLWRLVPQNRSWQKELKSTWDALCEGKYEWAHLAMHLWPEGVVPKCSSDRSLAISHGLEDAFWVEGTDGKWTARKTPPKSVDELVKERTSPAVKSALKSLLEAPAAAGKSGGRRGGSRRKAAAAAEGGDV